MDGQVHIGMFVYPIPGRLIPAMTLASRLVEQGAKVTLFCPSHRLSNLTEAKSRGYSPDIQVVELKLNDDKVNAIAESPFKDLELLSLMSASLRQSLENLTHPPSCFIGDEVCHQIAEVVRSFKLKCYCFVPQSALALSATLFVRKLDEHSLLPLSASQKTLVDIPSLQVPLTSDEYLSQYLEEYNSSWVTDMFKRAALLIHQSSGILVNTFEQLEHTILSAAREDMVINPNAVQILPVGPLIPEVKLSAPAAQREEEALCNNFLNGRPSNSVVFASFGSLLTFSRQQAMAVFEGLEASGFPYIWMARLEDGSPAPKPRNNVHGLIISTWVPQLQILSHDSTGLFVTHCGWNSTLEGISCGVPMLAAIPTVIDQKINCKLSVDLLKVGLRLTGLEKDTIAQSIKAIMNSQDIRANSQALKASAKEAGAIADQTIKTFVDSLSAAN